MVQWSNHQIQTIGIHSTMGESIPIVFFFAILTYKKYDPGKLGMGLGRWTGDSGDPFEGTPGTPKNEEIQYERTRFLQGGAP